LHVPEKAVLSTKEAWEYVGGRIFFGQLLDAYPKILMPIRECKPTGINSKGKTQYWRSTIDHGGFLHGVNCGGR
jgi:hypothetical protein